MECGMYGGQVRCTQYFGGEFGRKRDNSEPRHGWPDCINMDHREVLRVGRH